MKTFSPAKQTKLHVVARLVHYTSRATTTRIMIVFGRQTVPRFLPRDALWIAVMIW